MKQLPLFDAKPAVLKLTCSFGAPWPCGPCAKCATCQGDER